MSQGCAEQSDTPVELNGLSARATKYQCVTGLQYNNAGMFALRDLTSIAFPNDSTTELCPTNRRQRSSGECCAPMVSISTLATSTNPSAAARCKGVRRS